MSETRILDELANLRADNVVLLAIVQRIETTMTKL
jgi:hypothetical protein